MIAALVSTAVIVSTVLVLGPFSVDPDPVSVAVLDFKNNSGEEGFDRILAGLLTTDLAQTPSVRVLSRERMRELQEGLYIETVDETTGFDLARQAGVQVLISGEVVKIGGKLRVNASVFDVETKDLLFARSEEGEGTDAVFDMIDDLSRSIRKELKVVPRWGGDSEPSLAALTTGSVDAYRLFSRGEDLRDSEPKEAVAYMEQAVAQDRTFAEAYMELALLYNHQLNDSDKALDNALRAKALSKSKSPKEYLKSLIYESWVMQNWDGVIEYMTQYLELQPNDMRIQRRKGWVLARDEATYDEAISHFKRMIELDPENISGEMGRVCNHLGNLYMRLGRFDEAIATFEHYRSFSPGHPGPLHSIGNAYMHSGRYDEAVSQFSGIIEDNPGYFPSYESLGQTYLAMGRRRDALDTFRRYLAAAPPGHSAGAHMRLAEAHCRQGDYILADEEINKALALDGSSVCAHWRKGLIALATEGCEGALEELETIEKLLENPSESGWVACFHHLSGMILLADGKCDEGFAELKRAVESSPRDESYYFSKELVKGCLESGFTEDAIRTGTELLSYNPNDGELLSLLGRAYEQEGDLERMGDYLQLAVWAWKEADQDFAPLRTVREKL
jgi:tetratricopeptide (TPR) repeat protein/TolB-like protein